MGFREARLRAGLKVADVQKAIGVSDTAVYMWELGTTHPKVSLLPKLAALYGCTVDELLAKDAENPDDELETREIQNEVARTAKS